MFLIKTWKNLEELCDGVHYFELIRLKLAVLLKGYPKGHLMKSFNSC